MLAAGAADGLRRPAGDPGADAGGGDPESALSREGKPSRGRRGWVLLAAFAAVLIGMRLGGLQCDPPSWLPTDHMYDEGWWADAARGQHHFGNPFADDFGTSHLLTPLHTALLRGSFQVFGIGLFAARFASAVGGVLLVLGLVVWLARREGWVAAAAAAGLGLASPMAWAYGRLAVLESEQCCLIFAAFACWFGGVRGRGFWAGLLLAAATAIKPNSVTLGLIPFVAAVVGCRLCAVADSGGGTSPADFRGREVLGFAVAFGLGIAGLLAWVYLPHADAYEALLASESGSGKVSLWARIAHMGQAFTSRWSDRHYLWWLLKGSPALTVATWLFCLQVALAWSGRRRDLPVVLSGLGAMGLLWLLVVVGVIGHEFYQPKRRLLFLFAPMLLLGALFVHRAWSRESKRVAWDARSVVGRFVFWAVLTWPVLVLAKPRATAWLAARLPEIPLDGVVEPEPGAGYVAGWILLLAWVGGSVGAALLGKIGRVDRWAMPLAGRLGLVLVGLLWLVEGGLLARSYQQLGASLDDLHRELPHLVTPGETVLGNAAATVFLPVPVATVRRQLPGEFSSPPPNPDVFDRLRPRYILEEHISNYMDARPHYADCVEDFELLRVLRIGPFRGEVPKHAFRLLVRKPD